MYAESHATLNLTLIGLVIHAYNATALLILIQAHSNARAVPQIAPNAHIKIVQFSANLAF
jgi:hypothetical protein